MGDTHTRENPPGHYSCSQCEKPLFSSLSKYAHSSPWPAFDRTLEEDSVAKKMEMKGTYKAGEKK